MKHIYLDNAATTQVSKPVLEAMLPYLGDVYGNPSSVHWFGREARKALNAFRRTCAAAIGATDEANIHELYFTSCGTESDNWAIRGAAMSNVKKGRHIITSQIEHHAVLHTCAQLEKEGWEVTYLPVDGDGLIDPESVRAAIRPDTVLVSIMMANNEIGTVEPIAEIAKICREKGVLCHTDAVQAVGHVPIDVHELGVDMLSLSGHKIHAPKGIGALYVRRGVKIDNFIQGGAQEFNRRAGTENMPYIAGLAKAMEIACANVEERAAKLSQKRDWLIQSILTRIPDTRLNGSATQRLPGNANISIRYIEGESILLNLDMKGIAASSGSACTSGSLDPSHVLLAIGLPHEIAHGSLRLTLDEDTTMDDLEYTVDSLEEIVSRLRAMSPLMDDADAPECDSCTVNACTRKA